MFLFPAFKPIIVDGTCVKIFCYINHLDVLATIMTKWKPDLSIYKIPHFATYLLLPVGVGGGGGLLDCGRWPLVGGRDGLLDCGRWPSVPLAVSDEAVFGRRVVVRLSISQNKDICIILLSTNNSDHVLRGEMVNLSKLL